MAALKNKLRGAFGDTTDFARDITQQLEAKLGRNIDDLRDRIEQEVAQHKKEMEDTYRDRVSACEGRAWVQDKGREGDKGRAWVQGKDKVSEGPGIG